MWVLIQEYFNLYRVSVIFKKSLSPCALPETSLSIERVDTITTTSYASEIYENVLMSKKYLE